MGFTDPSFAPPSGGPPSDLERKVQALLVQRSNLELALKQLLGAVDHYPELHGATREACALCAAVPIAKRALEGVRDV